MPSRSRSLALVTLAGLGLSACTNVSSEEQVMSTGIGDVQASWSSIDSEEGLPAQPQIAVVASTPSAGELPALTVGSLGQPGEPRSATVWKAGEVGSEHGQALEVGGSESWANAL